MPRLRLAVFFAMLAPVWGVEVAASLPSADRAPVQAKHGSDDFVFSLWPTAFQRHPRLDFNVVTEMTGAGRKWPAPSPKNPAYYVVQAGQPYNGGLMGPEGSLDPRAGPQFFSALERALGENGFRPAAGTGQSPTIVIIYQYGAYAFNPPVTTASPMLGEVDNGAADPALPEDVALPEREIRRALLNRALLLGGRKFAAQIADAMDQVDVKARLERVFAAPDGAEASVGSVGALLPDSFDRLRAQSVAMERLVEELFASSYFVVASAYDYKALAKGERRLLWRTKMTVNSMGVNMAESLPPLIASAAPFLGRETAEPVAMTKQVSRSGRVEVGTPTVDERAPAAPNPLLAR